MSVHLSPSPTLHQLLEADAAGLVRVVLASLPLNQRLLVVGVSRAQGLDLEAMAQRTLVRLSGRNLEVLTAALVDRLGSHLATAGLVGQYDEADVDRAMAALADVLGR